MSSRLKMILLEGTPAIKLTLEKSEDLVDTVFQMFTEKFGGRSMWLRRSGTVYGMDNNGVPDTNFKTDYYTPITPDELFKELISMAKMAKHQDPDIYQKVLNRIVSETEKKVKSGKTTNMGFDITTYDDNTAEISLRPHGPSEEEYSLAMINMVRDCLKSISEPSCSNYGEVYKALNKLYKDMPVLCGLQSEVTGSVVSSVSFKDVPRTLTKTGEDSEGDQSGNNAD